ncbi:3-phosphoshikimate 1-carboxyvinyltransferase [Streptomyces sp. FH025]|uniref:3-phosphoshikimate 1-carboxyvinyltransferase n=1 Tax=Streptomyces sp. FH025 TaxID=2815937 RepID=UPI001A9F9806|nr:3-phosphoshikimate 1-carboxyvinyltransferase [Streptomyces sp. FH025]MBO1413639.1 3-phosphoshikimate 1-carboxyvinyltransferase [Streptomyces sp. FH025]
MNTPIAPPRALNARVPGSKSLTNRALLLATAADATSVLAAPLVSEDTVAFRDALPQLGSHVESLPDNSAWRVTGIGCGPDGDGRIWCADAGTAARFLPPLAATGHGDFVFEGSAQLTARPVAPLADALRRLGALVDTAPGGTLPLRVRSRGLDGGSLDVDGGLSSQFLSGLLMAGPLLRTPLLVRVREMVSRPYIDMTIALMRHFGAEVAEDFPGEFTVRPTGYRAADLRIEPDASTASYFFAAAAVTGCSVTVDGLGLGSLQGDVRFVDVLERTGARVRRGPDATTVTGTGVLRGGFTVDMGEISDTFMTLAAIAPLADAPITVRGIGHARLKESDRIEAVARNLRASGIRTETGRDWITVHPGSTSATRIACQRDHRVAMAFSVLNLRTGNLTLDDPGCVAKTFPGFHEEMHRLFPQHPLPASARQ